MPTRVYEETFDNGPAGWWGWISNSGGPKALEHESGTVTSRSPWWIDYNHAPPGAGYLHMLFCSYTRGVCGEHFREVGGSGGLADQKMPTNFTNAQITVRLRGELIDRGAQLVFLIQATIGDITSGWALTGQPVSVTEDWSEQTITCVPDESQWICMGGRHDRVDYYSHLPLETVLGDVNNDVLFILFPVTVKPMGDIGGDPHILRPEKDYPVWRSALPEGYVTIDTLRIAFEEDA